MSEASEQLLAGPRGRRLCWELAVPAERRVPEWAWELERDPPPERVRDVCRQLEQLDAPSLTADVHSVLIALGGAVDWAWYWQPPLAIDRMLARPEFRAVLAPLAEALTETPQLAWWHRPVAIDRQRYVQFIDETPDGPPALQGADRALARWREDALATEVSRRRSRRFWKRPASGEWWSTPEVSALVHTSGPAAGLEALGLILVEDGFGQEQARVWTLRPADGARVLEIREPEDWARLVAAYPLKLTESRGPDWSTVTGITGRWFVPDWTAVADDHDGVHLSVAGYLATNGRALEVPGGHTMLAGWDPDATWWLNDVLRPAGEPRVWFQDDDDPFLWLPHTG